MEKEQTEKFHKGIRVLCWGVLGATIFAAFKLTLSWWGKRKKKKLGKIPIPYRIIKKQVLTKNVPHPVIKLTLETGGEDQPLGLDVGDHIRIYHDNQTLARPYTPITKVTTKGYFEIVFKVYNAINGKPAGEMTKFLKYKNVGDEILIAGPIKGHQVKKKVKHVTFIAGGTGITPCVQAMIHWLDDPKNENTKVTLLYANTTENDILLKNYLDDLTRKYPKQLFIKYIVSRPSTDRWDGEKGRISQEMINKYVPSLEKQPSQQVGICGPAPFVKAVRTFLLAKGMKRKEHFFVY